MWTKKAHLIIVSIRVNKFYLPIAAPTFLINSLVTELCDLVNFFTFFNAKITGYVNLTETAVHSLTDFPKYDFVDIDAYSKEDKDKVKIKICTR